jgi:hypothetical protein
MAQKLKEALAGPAKDKKEPAVADGILSVTPDPPEAAEWRKSVLDTIAADSSFPADDEAGTALLPPIPAAGWPSSTPDTVLWCFECV